jgi:hypothetical protein
MNWIDVKKEKPKHNQEVLVYCVPKYSYDEDMLDFEINIGYLEVDDTWYLSSKNLDEIQLISHWMELPLKPI